MLLGRPSTPDRLEKHVGKREPVAVSAWDTSSLNEHSEEQH
jgi:hypothetical protein